MFKLLPKHTPDQLLLTFQNLLGFDDSPDSYKIKTWNAEINDFGVFVKKAESILKDMREKVRDMIQTWEKSNQHYKELSQFLTKYENHNLNQYWDSMHTKYYFRQS